MHDKEIYEVLRDLGVPAHLKGYTYACKVINLAMERPELMSNFVRNVYGTVARDLGTTSARIERAIRHAIAYVFANTDTDVLYRYFGHTISLKSGKVSNKCFVATIAEYIKLKEQ